MATAVALLESYIFTGITGNTAYAIARDFWQRAFGKSLEALYLDAFAQAVENQKPQFKKYGDAVEFDREARRKALHYDLALDLDQASLTGLGEAEFVQRLADAMQEKQILVIGGHSLDAEDYKQLVRNLIRQTEAIFHQKVLDNEAAFNEVLLTEVQGDRRQLAEVRAYFATRFDLVLQKLDVIDEQTRSVPVIEEKVDAQSEIMEQVAGDIQAIKRHLGLDRPQTAIVQEIQVALDAAPRGAMFEPDGLCSGYPLRPILDRYFVAQEFSPDRDDLRGALADALTEFGMRPIYADDFMWSGHILCKISALIQGTPFGVYQLTVSQNRNVYLELGIALGLGRPFVLVKEKDAEVSPLAQGLEYHPIDSYLELRYDLGEKVRPFLANIASYRPQALPPAGSQRTAVIAHGNLDVIDFCVPVAKMISEHGLTPEILGDPTGKLARYLELEGITHRIIGSTGGTRLDETVAAIQAACLGVYRIDKAGAPDTFLALGASMGLNRPGILIHKANRDVPSDVRGLSALRFDSYTGLERSFPERLGHLLRRYS